MAQKTQIEIDIEAKITDSEALTDIRAINKAVRELQALALQAGDSNSAAFLRAAEAAGELRDRVADLNANTRAISGEPIERLGNSFGQIGSSLRNLDFDQASAGVSVFINTLSNFKIDDVTSKINKFKQSLVEAGQNLSERFGPRAVKTFEGLSNVIGGLGGVAVNVFQGKFGSAISSLGQAFNGLGQIIRANPLLFLAGIVVTLIANFDRLKNVGGALGTTFKIVGEIVKAITFAFQALTDAIRLTGFAEQRQSEQFIRNKNDEIKAIKERYDLEIGLAKAAGKEVRQLTLQQLYEEKKATTDQLVEYGRRAQAQRGLNDEDKKASQETFDRIGELDNEIRIKQKELEVFRAGSADRIRQAQISAMNDETARAIAQSQFNAKKAKDDLALTEKSDEEKAATTIAIEKQSSNEIAKIRKDVADKAAQAAEQARAKQNQKDAESLAKRKQAAQSEVQALAEARDIILLQDDQVSSERLAKLKENTDARVKYIKDNEKLIYGSEGSKKAAADIAKINAQQAADEKQLNDYIIDLTAKRNVAIAALNIIRANNAKEQLDAELEQSRINEAEKVRLAKGSVEQIELAQAQGNAERNKLEQDFYNKQRDAILQSETDEFDSQQRLTAANGNRLGDRLNDINSYADLEKSQRLARYQDEVADAIKNGQDLSNINQEYLNNEAAAEKEAQRARLEEVKKFIQQRLQVAQAFTGAVNALNDLITQNESAGLKKGEKLSLEIQKKQFKRNKALKIVDAVINTATAITAQLGAGPVGFVLAALAAATGAIQIATIAKQKFDPDGGSSSPTAPATISLGGGSGDTTATKSFTAPTLFGLGNGQLSSGPDSNQRVYVLENDITRSQGRVATVQRNATFP